MPRAGALSPQSAAVVAAVERRGWVEAALSETVDAPDRRSWLLGVRWPMTREAVVNRRLAGLAGQVVAAVAAVWTVVVVTGGITYAPLRHAMIAQVVVIAAVSLLGCTPGVFGPVADGVPARTRAVSPLWTSVVRDE
jgi:hypothetical protein